MPPSRWSRAFSKLFGVETKRDTWPPEVMPLFGKNIGDVIDPIGANILLLLLKYTFHPKRERERERERERILINILNSVK